MSVNNYPSSGPLSDDIIILLNQNYAKNDNIRQTYDLVIPKNASGNTGLVLCIHGGGWIEGSKDDYTENLFQMSEKKRLACACMNYRFVSDNSGFDEILDDISSALSDIKAKSEQFGINIDKVLLTGVSAGGHLSLLYAYSRKDVAPIKPVCVVELCSPTDLEDNFYYSEENSISKAVGVEYFRSIISKGIKFKIDPDNFESAGPALKKYSPINYIDNNTVPTFFGHGENDDIVPYNNSVDLDNKLTEYDIEHKFISFPDSGHKCEDKNAMSQIMKLFFECADKYLL